MAPAEILGNSDQLSFEPLAPLQANEWPREGSTISQTSQIWAGEGVQPPQLIGCTWMLEEEGFSGRRGGGQTCLSSGSAVQLPAKPQPATVESFGIRSW